MIFSGEVAWVTGSSTGIGRAAALALAREGCRVAVHYNSSEAEAAEVVREAEALGREAMAVGGDVSEPDEVRRMADEVEERFGGVDILVNNAGALVQRTPFKEITPELWDRVLDVNLKSVLLCSQAALPMMERRGGGRIVNVTSVAARNGGGPGSAAYATAKAGVSNLTRAMAKELLPDGIIVNAVAPGVITTPFHDRYTPPEARRKLAQTIPMGREGRPDEVSGAVVFLASPAACYVVGEILEVNGGQLMD